MNRRRFLTILPGLSIPIGWAATPAVDPNPEQDSDEERWSKFMGADFDLSKIKRLPEPNAFNDFVDAIRAIADLPSEVELPQPRTAAELQRRKKDRRYTTEEKARMVRRNRRALDALRRGLPKPYRCGLVSTVMGDFVFWGRCRALARRVRLEGDVKSEGGDPYGAVQSHLDNLRFGAKIKSDSAILGFLIAESIEAIGRRGIKAEIGRLTPSEAKTAARSLEEIALHHTPFFHTVVAEQRFIKGYRASMNPFGFMEKDFIGRWRMSRLARYYDQMDAAVVKPFASRPRELFREKPRRSETIGGKSVESAWLKERVSLAQNLLLMTELALRAWKGEHGDWPNQLADLVPTYLTRVPNDPFAVEGSLVYRTTPAGYLLYSVGPDGVDDGGMAVGHSVKLQPSLLPEAAESARRRVDLDSRGDIVAGVNRE